MQPSPEKPALRRILMFGHCHSVFIHPLAANLKQHGNYHVSVLELLAAKSETRGLTADGVYDQVCQPPDITQGPGWRKAFREIVADENGCGFWELTGGLIREVWKTKKLDSARNQLRDRHLVIARLRYWKQLYSGFDLYHLHYMDPAFRDTLQSLPANAKLLMTIWGSDLLRSSGVDAYARQFDLCQRADLITVRSLEMREIFLAKFGRALAPKVRIAKIGSGILKFIDQQRGSDARKEFARENGLDASKFLVCLGHNGHPDNQHLAMLEALKSLDDATRQQVVFFIPSGYGGDTAYHTRLEQAAVAARLEVRILDKFLTNEGIARLRFGTDVLIHVPVSDAMSAALCETLYAGNPAITGAWLPYGELRRRDVPLREVRTVGEILERLRSLLKDLPGERQRVAGCQPAIRDVLDWNQVSTGWRAVYDESISRN